MTVQTSTTNPTREVHLTVHSMRMRRAPNRSQTSAGTVGHGHCAEAQRAAVLEERQRLARDLHDAVTQSLFSTAIIAEVLPGLWEVDPAEGRQRLAELQRLTVGALAELRALLVELRPGALDEIPLPDLLRQLAQASMSHGRVQVQVAVEVDIDGLESRRLPPEVKVTLYRLAQEALNNVSKHARASHVTVSLRATPEGIDLVVQDDGHGFGVGVTPPGHFGLRGMRERAEGIGAKLKIESGIGNGTRVWVSWRHPQSTTATTERSQS